MKRKILSIITALALCLSLCPARALAAEASGAPTFGGQVKTEGNIMTVTLNGSEPVDLSKCDNSIDVINISGTGTINYIKFQEAAGVHQKATVTIESGANVTIGSTEWPNAFELSFIDSKLIIENGAVVVANGGIAAGESGTGGSVEIRGTLTSTRMPSTGALSIKGGTLTATDSLTLCEPSNDPNHVVKLPEITGGGKIEINTTSMPSMPAIVPQYFRELSAEEKQAFEQATAKYVDLNANDCHFGYYQNDPDNKVYTLLKNSDNTPVTNLTILSSNIAVIPVTGVTLDKNALKLAVGGTKELTAAVAPSNTTLSKAVSWTSSDASVATVNNGTITGIAPGTATITVKTFSNSFYPYEAEEGGSGPDSPASGQQFTATCTVTVVPAGSVLGVTLDKSTLDLTEDSTEQLTATVEPADAVNKNVTWSSDDTSVATVDEDGKVTAVAAGTATITVTTEDGNEAAACTVIVTRKPAPPAPFEPSAPATPSTPAIPSVPAFPGMPFWPSSGGVTTYAITVERPEHGKVASSHSSANSSSTVTLTVTPDSGYELDALAVTDSQGNEVRLTARGSGEYTFTMPEQSVTVTAVFTPLPAGGDKPCDGGMDCPSRRFPDLGTVGIWYHEAVDYVLRNGLMGGYSSGLFGPDDNLTRAQLAQILYNMAGAPVVTNSVTFTDVAPGQWCTPAVTWAAANGIIRGYGDGRFGPNDNITREQLAVMLWRYAGSPSAAGRELPFTDAYQASGYALEALRWAVENGILSGYDGGQLNPAGLATRAQAAQMLKNYMNQ